MPGTDETPLAARRGHPHPEASRIAVADVEGGPERKQRLDAGVGQDRPGHDHAPEPRLQPGKRERGNPLHSTACRKNNGLSGNWYRRFRWWCGSPGFGLQSQVSGPPLRQALNRGFHEPTSIRAGSSACRNSSYHASAASDCDLTENDNRATCPPEPAWGASGSRRCRLSVTSMEDSSSGTAMGSATAPGVPCYRTPVGTAANLDDDADSAPVSG